VSGHIGHVAEDPNTLQEAFVATNTGAWSRSRSSRRSPITLEYLMLWTDKSKIITYGIASAAGVIAGSAAYALATRPSAGRASATPRTPRSTSSAAS
jgi:hypothetical protein